ncbi:transporter substrate-binding domain-containing protein [Undibacterium sp. Jales W-56]|uniref:substrate-binding periplasmic protein n=1 Tax=Undibacterium sp. Jales W-56 TaxID=2897325 RepID=UPI0021D21EC7|nr:transporter substrate-binding domain-containing protein [Undibacterium sp. Jales W-56]MCU6434297.1 transporter substrate-binding domain-containing protein [Undibacterium sp. Jales W-56]
MNQISLFRRLRALSAPSCWLLLGLLCQHVLVSAQNLDIYTEDWPPISYANADKKAEGMAVEVVQALQERLGSTNVVQVVPWARGYNAVLEEPNVMLFTMGRSEEREKLVVLLGPVVISNTALYTRKGNAARLLAMGEGMRKLPVGAYHSSIFADTARKKGYTNISEASKPQTIATMLLRGRFDLWVEGSLVVPSIIKEIGHAPDEVEQVMVLDSLELYLAFSRKTPASTIKAWEEAFRWLKKSGGYAKIYKKWLPGETPPMEVVRLGTSSAP